MDRLISEKEVLKAFEKYLRFEGNFHEMIKAIPSAEPKTGHWIMTGEIDVYYDLPSYECSKCGQTSFENGDYCPNCGARMVEIQESEG